VDLGSRRGGGPYTIDWGMLYTNQRYNMHCIKIDHDSARKLSV
jgi:hypothetical protein